MSDAIRLGVLGIDHRHIWGMLGNMLAQGCSCAGWWTGAPTPHEAMFARDFPDVPRVAKAAILEDPGIDMVLISAVPADRAALAIAAMEAGKDVMVDKPGCTTLGQLAALRECQARTGRIWTVNFSERLEVPAAVKAEELVADGAIGRIKQVLGVGPHRQNLAARPDWFFQRERYGGILCDIGSHQVDQFLFFTGSGEVTIDHALVENTTLPQHPEVQDYGEMVLTGDKGHGYIRVDWFTPEALPTWGDGRLFLLGEQGYIELRKYTDLGRGPGNQLLLANGETVQQIDCSKVPLRYFARLVADVQTRSETAIGQAHTFKVMDIALTAQAMAEARA